MEKTPAEPKSVGWIRRSLTFKRGFSKIAPIEERPSLAAAGGRLKAFAESLPSQARPLFDGALKRVLQVCSLLVCDSLCFFLALATAILLRTKVFPSFYSGFPSDLYFSDIYNLWWCFGLWIVLLWHEGLYSKTIPFVDEVLVGWKATFLAALVSAFLFFFIKPAGLTSRTVLLIGWLIVLWLFPLTRYLGKRFLVKLGLWKTKVLVLGVGKGSQLLFKSLIGEKTLGYEIAGFLDGNRAPTETSAISYDGRSAPVLGNLHETEKFMNLLKTRDLLVDLTDTSNRREYINILAELQKTAESVTVVPDFQDLPMLGAKLDFLFSQRFFLLRVPSNLSKPWKLFIKTVFDFTVAGFLFLTILPILFLIALAVKIDSRGPVFFTQKRVGRKGKPFTCYKFRTMVHNAEEMLKNHLENSPEAKAEWERNSKLINDPRITKLGKVLRISSLDELPQILNVLKGEMSLVGPRPLTEEEIEKYGPDIDFYYGIRPGITGLSQVSGRNKISFQERVAGDIWYIRNWSLWLDVMILLRTVRVVLQREGAY